MGITALMLAVTMVVGGCSQTLITVYVDNDSESSIRVEIEGEGSLYVGPGNSAKRKVHPGPHRVVVKRKGEVIFDEVKTFENSPGGFAWRHYLLDPEADTRYAVYEVYYYPDQKTANKNKSSRKIRQLGKGNWIEVPDGVCALTSMPVVFTSSDAKRVSRQCVQRSN